MNHRTLITRFLLGASTLAMLGCITAACILG
jgi:hypothetical protein